MNAQQIFINSKDRINGSANNIVIRDLDTAAERQGLTIQNLIIPLTNYNVNTNNNSISVGVGITSTSSILTYYDLDLSIGNYTSSEFLTGFQTLTTGIGTSGIIPSLDSKTGIITYTCDDTLPLTRQRNRNISV